MRTPTNRPDLALETVRKIRVPTEGGNATQRSQKVWGCEEMTVRCDPRKEESRG